MGNCERINEMIAKHYPDTKLRAEKTEKFGTTLDCINIYDNDVLLLTIDNSIYGWTIHQHEKYSALEFIKDIYEAINH